MFALDTWLLTLGVALILLRPHDWQKIMYALGKWVNHVGLPLHQGMQNSLKDSREYDATSPLMEALLQKNLLTLQKEVYDHDTHHHHDHLRDAYSEACYDHYPLYTWPLSHDLHLRTIPMPCLK